MRSVVIALFVMMFAVLAHGQADDESLLVQFNPYTSLRAHYAILDGESEFQDNASRLGIGFNVGKSKGIKFIGRVELSIRLLQSTTILNADSRTTSGFIVFDVTQERQVFASRLGYLGVDLGNYGVLTIGKQWSTYYDITGWTDQFNVFGGTASNTYVAGTDGSIGTGRSDQALIYRVHPGRWHFGIQVLASSTRNDTFIDGYGGSVRYELFRGFSVGGAYQRSLLANDIVSGVLGLDGDPEYIAAGFQYLSGRTYISAIYARQTNGDLTKGLLDEEEEDPSVAFDDHGFELAAAYRFNKWRVLAGANLEWVDVEDLPLHPDFHFENYMFGLEYRLHRLAYFYGELRIDEGVDFRGNEAFNVFALGLRIDLSHQGEKKFGYKPASYR